MVVDRHHFHLALLEVPAVDLVQQLVHEDTLFLAGKIDAGEVGAAAGVDEVEGVRRLSGAANHLPDRGVDRLELVRQPLQVDILKQREGGSFRTSVALRASGKTRNIEHPTSNIEHRSTRRLFVRC